MESDIDAQAKQNNQESSEVKSTNPSKLDHIVDLTKNIAIVGLTAFGAYRALSDLNAEFSYLGLFIFGGAIIYALYLPYKVAGLKHGEWGFIARARVVRTIIFGIPLWILLALILSWDSTIAESVILFTKEPSSVEFERPFLLFTLFVIVSSSAVSGIGLSTMLRLAGFDKDKSNHLMGYLKSSGLRDTMMVSLIVLFSEAHILLGLINSENQVISQGYLNLGFLYFILLVLYGFFYPIYVPERYASESRVGIEFLAGAALFFSPINPIIGISLTIFFLFVLLSKMKQYPSISVSEIRNQVEQETQQVKDSWWGKRIESFWARHSLLSTIISRVVSLAYILGVIFWSLGFDTLLIIVASIVVLILFFIVALFKG